MARGRVITAQQRAKVAAALRDGASQPEAARVGGISARSVANLLNDPLFAALVKGESIVTSGHVLVHGDPKADSDPLGGLPPSRAFISVPDLNVIGSILHPLADPSPPSELEADSPVTVASIVDVEFILTPKRQRIVTACLARGEQPPRPTPPDDHHTALTLYGLIACQQDRSKTVQLIALSGCLAGHTLTNLPGGERLTFPAPSIPPANPDKGGASALLANVLPERDPVLDDL